MNKKINKLIDAINVHQNAILWRGRIRWQWQVIHVYVFMVHERYKTYLALLISRPLLFFVGLLALM
jgi:hypothetical protein